jgi:hypothetical protein
MLNSWYEQLLGAFKNYEKATDELINRQIRPLQSDNSLQKLSTDARASSRLRQCLCHVCPEGCHTFHTAFLSLEPENLNAVIDSSASKSPSTEVNPETMWQCHMAFKSTVTKKDSLIWLKVVSNVTVNHPPSTMTSNISTSLDAPQKRDKESLSPESEGATPHVSSRKRRASSTPPEPAFKTPKTRPGQPHRHSDLAVRISSSIELCPEFLTQHDTTEHAVMKIVDNGGCGHNIYYLAQEERLAYGVRYMTLDKLLKNRRSHRYCTALTSLFSRLRLARLIAEAVLRFDLRDSDPAPDKNIYVHGLGSKGAGAGGGYLSLVNGHNLPALFLAIRLEKQEHSFLGAPSVGFLGSENMGGSNETAGRENVLVNLGTILLRIGVESDDKLQLNQAPMGLDWGRRFISENAAETEIGNAYANVVRNCARFFEDNEFMTDELFRDKFFSTIVLPLKHCEKSILPKRG